MIIFKTKSFVYKLKAFWMIHHNDNFIFKIMRLCVGSGFLVSHHKLNKLRHSYDLSPMGTMSDHNWWVFHPRGGGGGGGGGGCVGIYPNLLIPSTYFLYHFNQPCDFVGRCPI